MPITEDEDD